MSTRLVHCLRTPALLAAVLAALALTSGGAVAQDGTRWAPEWYIRVEGELGDIPPSSMEWLKEDLERASAWMQSHGFRAPKLLISDDSTRYFATMDPAYAQTRGGCGGNKLAHFDPEFGMISLGVGLFQDSGKIIAPAALRDGHVQYGEGFMLAAVHEAFHGVQHAYRDMLEWHRSIEWLWLYDGTAEAIRYAWAEKEYGRADLPARAYDHSLHRPRLRTNPCQQKIESYNTSHFWYLLGRDIGSPDGIGYLREVLEANATDPDPARHGLRGVVRALAPYDGGLYNLYPRFIARHVRDTVFFERVTELDELSPARPQLVYDRASAAPLPPLATHAYFVRVSLPDTAAPFSLRVVEPDPSLHLIVDGERYDLPAEAGERNVFRATLPPRAEPYEFFVRVANVAPDPVETTNETYQLEMTLGLPRQCLPDAMIAAADPDAFPVQALRPVLDDPAHLPRPHPATLVFDGLIGDGGDACAHHVGEVDLLGGIFSGTTAPADLRVMAERAEEIRGRMARDGIEVDTAGWEDRTVEDRSRVVEAVRQLGGVMRATDADAVLNVYSVNVIPWYSGGLTQPEGTTHDGLGGWQPNSAANLLIQLPGTTPGELRAGGTYEAVAYAPPLDGADAGNGIIPSRIGFYTSWSGRRVPISRPPARTERARAQQRTERQMCERARAALREMTGGEPALAATLGAAVEQMDCGQGGMAFEGTREVLTGLLRGTVTIERITAAEVTGRFELEGDATLHVRTSELVHREGRVSRERERDEERAGWVSVRGSFSAPNTTAGSTRGSGSRTVVVPPQGRR